LHPRTTGGQGFLECGQIGLFRQAGLLLVYRERLRFEVTDPRTTIKGFRAAGDDRNMIKTERIRGSSLSLGLVLKVAFIVDILLAGIKGSEHHGHGHQRQVVYGLCLQQGPDSLLSRHTIACLSAKRPPVGCFPDGFAVDPRAMSSAGITWV
jgi:hypothetical protein